MSSTKTLYRVSFLNNGKAYEVYAKYVSHEEMYGFVEVEEFIFGETTSVVVDPGEEKLKVEFENVQRSYIPLHSIIRIDEVTKEGCAKIIPIGDFKNKAPTVVYTKDPIGE